MIILLFFLGGAAIGSLTTIFMLRASSTGTLRVVADNESTYVYAVLKNGITDIQGKRFVKFYVDEVPQE